MAINYIKLYLHIILQENVTIDCLSLFQYRYIIYRKQVLGAIVANLASAA